MKKLLIETLPIKLNAQELHESSVKNDGRLIVKNMKIQQADQPNKNRRIYPRSILEREVKKLFENCRKTESRGIIGELDHPNSEILNLKNACLGVLDYRWKGNDMLGDVEILNTPNGNILKEIITAGYVPGISSRGMGSVKELHEGEDDIVEVDDDFELVCWDAVSDPSSHNAYFKEIREGRNINENYQKQLNPKQSNINQLMSEILCELGNQCCWK